MSVRDPDGEPTEVRPVRDVRPPDDERGPPEVAATDPSAPGRPAAASPAAASPAAASPAGGAAGPPAGAPPPGAAGGQDANGTARSVRGAVAEGVRTAGAPVLGFLEAVGNHIGLAGRALTWLPRPPYRIPNYLDAAEYIGFGSLPIILLVGAFTGAVTSLQSVYAFRRFGLESFSGGATGLALAIELGPVLTSLMLAGRVAAGIATELGTMRITEQIDALESMAVSPVQYLVLPRLIAGMVVTPILALLFFVVGMGGAWIAAVVVEHVDQGQWIANLRDLVEPKDVIEGLIKSVFFGFLVALIGCYQGYNATGGGRGVGLGTTRAVVIASVTTLVLDYFLTDVLLAIFHGGTR